MNIFEFAMQMEKDGEQYYRELASKTNDKGLISIFNMLADDEVKHYHIIQQMMNNQTTAMVDTEVLANAKNIFAEMKQTGQSMVSDTSQIDMYRHAQENEKKSEDFYRQKAAEVDESNRDILLRMAEEEKRHYFLLDNIIEFVNRPDTWLENAEFNHLDEY